MTDQPAKKKFDYEAELAAIEEAQKKAATEYRAELAKKRPLKKKPPPPEVEFDEPASTNGHDERNPPPQGDPKTPPPEVEFDEPASTNGHDERNPPPQGDPKTPTKNALKLTYFRDCDTAAKKQHFIKGVLAANETSTWIGPPGAGKSAIGTDAVIHYTHTAIFGAATASRSAAALFILPSSAATL
jgi:hypothetical protein